MNQLSPQVTATIISALVSLAVTLITVFVTKGNIRAAREKLERELQRSMTAKLYEVRLAAYPKALEITEKLRTSSMEEQGDKLGKQYFKDVLSEIDAWRVTKAGFIMSGFSLDQLNTLRKALRQEPENGNRYSPEQIESIARAMREFRLLLWEDIRLLFVEDEEKKALINDEWFS